MKLILSTLLTASLFSASSADLCKGSCSADGTQCSFTVKVNFFEGEWGYFTFEECGDAPNPTLGLELGVTYTFDQTEISNYMHPLGFSYFADGAHDDQDELEPGIAPPGSDSSCDESASCAAPMYEVAGEYVGEYSNNAKIANITTGNENFGLDDYEPLFFFPILEWKGMGPYQVTLKLTDDDINSDIFYFCHIHQYMTGRIKVLKDGEKINAMDTPAIPYDYHQISDFDAGCGTYNLDGVFPHEMCPEQFVCNIPDDNAELMAFGQCIESMNCAMVRGMTNNVESGSEVALFLHQMIPHHQNAVNMAKALLKTGKVECDDIEDEDNNHCVLEAILRDIINNQNFQIQQMQAILDGEGYPETDQCVLEKTPLNGPTSGASTFALSSITTVVVAFAAFFL